MEGPFISPEKKGAHTLELLRDFKSGFEEIQSTYGPHLNKVDFVTLAPELGSFNVVKKCRYLFAFAKLNVSQ